MAAVVPQSAAAGAAPGAGAVGLRVAIVSDATAERNGVGSYYADLVAGLNEQGADARLYCPEGSVRGWHRYVAPPLPGDSTQRIWFPRPFRLWRRLRELAPHAIVVPTPGPYGLFGLLAARLLGCPLVVGFHTHYEALAGIYWSDFFGRVCRWYLESCNRLLFRHASDVLANSPDMIEQARRLGARDPGLMGTSVAREFLEREPVPLAGEVRRVLYAGRLAEEKNIALVIDAARARPTLAVSIAGDGPLRADVERAAAELANLACLGWVPRERLAETIDAHDLVLLPSQVESFGTVALEAMARGRLVLVSASCGIADWPDLAAGLYTIDTDETVTHALDRVAALPPADRSAHAAAARHAALRLNAWNVATWIERLRPTAVNAAHS